MKSDNLLLIKKSLSFLNKAEKLTGIKVLFLVVGMAIFEIIGIASIMPFLTILGDQGMIYENEYLALMYDFSKTIGVISTNDFLIFLGIGSFSLIIISAVYRTITQYYMNKFIEMRRHEIGLNLFAKYINQSYSFYIGRHSGELTKTVISEVDQLIQNYFRPVFNMLSYSVVLIFILALVMVVNPIVAIFTGLIMGGVYVIFYSLISKKLDSLGSTLVESNKDRFIAVSEAFGGIKSIKVHGCEDEYIGRFSNPSESYAKTLSIHQTLNQVPYYVIEAVAFGGIILACLFLLIIGDNNLGSILPILGLYAFSTYRIKPAMQFIFQGFAGLNFGRSAVENIFNELNAEINNDVEAKKNGKKFRITGKISISSLNYSYPSSEKLALRNLTLDIPAGSSLGVVGGTGAGKSTFVDILLGLLKPSSGSIKIDEVLLNNSNINSWQGEIGYVPQEIYLVDDTIAANIAFGIPKDKIDYDRVRDCAKLSQLDSFIENSMSSGYESMVGEKGIKLSGGQRQRIGIARALYNHPQVLVFDEATSALDTVTERELMQAIQKLFGTVTIIMIAHRISTVKNCDNIILLEDAEIIASGSYNDLKANPQFNKYIFNEDIRGEPNET